MEGERVLFDASSCMLFEASGDSEAEFFDTTVVEELGAEAEDDAQSCSCGWLSDSADAVHPIHAGEDDFNYEAEFDGCKEEEDGGGSTEVEDGVVDQWCSGGKTAEEEGELNKSMGCEDSKLMNDGETADRLFWEACLAS